MRSVITLVSAILLTAVATCSHAQGQPPAKAPAPKPAAARPAGTTASKPAAKPAANHQHAKTVVKKHAATNSTESAAGSSRAEQARIARRDPFSHCCHAKREDRRKKSSSPEEADCR